MAKLELREFNGVKWYYAGNDVNGNSRVLVEYTEFLTPQEVDTLTTTQAKEIATKRAKAAFSTCGGVNPSSGSSARLWR